MIESLGDGKTNGEGSGYVIGSGQAQSNSTPLRDTIQQSMK